MTNNNLADPVIVAGALYIAGMADSQGPGKVG
jgi:hypothetical protein